jgi:hypothetical protein
VGRDKAVVLELISVPRTLLKEGTTWLEERELKVRRIDKQHFYFEKLTAYYGTHIFDRKY